jgi:steroid 5-alpha reductase family enzyme
MMDVAWPGAKIAWSRADAERGFVQRGLWAWSRHPNFLCEQSFWATITFFPILTSPRPFTLLPTTLNIAPTSIAPHLRPLIALSPAIVLCLLFYSSTLFSESISLGKYPVGYAAYQRRVAMFLPFLTPFWGLWVGLRGGKDEVEGLVWGERVSDRKKVD